MAYVRCPHCNAKIKVLSNSQRSHTFESSARSPLRQTAAAPAFPPPPPMASGLSGPLRPGHFVQQIISQPSMDGNVHVPANQSLISGCLCGPVAGLVVYTALTTLRLSGSEAAWYGIMAGGIVMFGTAAVYWFKKTNFYDNLLVQQIEPYLDMDLDGDGAIGPPTIKVEVKSEDGNRWQFADLPGKPEALQDFAARVLMGQGFTDETGKLAGLTQAQVQDLRVVFVDRLWARWKHPTRRQQGIELWHVGKSVLRAIAASPSPTLSAST